jgi:hypothetical protein
MQETSSISGEPMAKNTGRISSLQERLTAKH